MGFKPVISSIINDYGMPSKEERLTLMFSATFPEEIQNLAADFLNDYVFLTIGKVGGTSSDIEQVIEEVPDSEKRDRLIDLLSTEGESFSCNLVMHLFAFSNNSLHMICVGYMSVHVYVCARVCVHLVLYQVWGIRGAKIAIQFPEGSCQ